MLRVGCAKILGGNGIEDFWAGGTIQNQNQIKMTESNKRCLDEIKIEEIAADDSNKKIKLAAQVDVENDTESEDESEDESVCSVCCECNCLDGEQSERVKCEDCGGDIDDDFVSEDECVDCQRVMKYFDENFDGLVEKVKNRFDNVSFSDDGDISLGHLLSVIFTFCLRDEKRESFGRLYDLTYEPFKEWTKNGNFGVLDFELVERLFHERKHQIVKLLI